MNFRRASEMDGLVDVFFQTIAPLPDDYPHATALTALRKHGLELHEREEWRRLCLSKQWTSAEAAEVVKKSRRS